MFCQDARERQRPTSALAEEVKLYAAKLIDSDPNKSAYDDVVEQLRLPNLDPESRRLLLQEKAHLEQANFDHQGHALVLRDPGKMDDYRRLIAMVRAYKDDPERLEYEWKKFQREKWL